MDINSFFITEINENFYFSFFLFCLVTFPSQAEDRVFSTILQCKNSHAIIKSTCDISSKDIFCPSQVMTVKWTDHTGEHTRNIDFTWRKQKQPQKLIDSWACITNQKKESYFILSWSCTASPAGTPMSSADYCSEEDGSHNLIQIIDLYGKDLDADHSLLSRSNTDLIKNIGVDQILNNSGIKMNDVKLY
ncbi:hypothetical protein LOC54_03875 [Acetobacter sp. AN02]|uniref:hypothetical protein n=1 Tax=Acetobacter sp. AN02 TaxID=2894186 RepID=UPI00243420F5|nr:hypothetical protein [Acetobacter sp. AN02]MDG6094258.1 hypothetical protein [Acetobacter sp. AN02]